MRTYSLAPVVAAASLLLAVGLGVRPPAAAPTSAVTVLVDGKTLSLPTSAATVAGVLAEVGISLHPLDRTAPAPDRPVADGMEVRVTRVTRHHHTEEVTVPAPSLVLGDPELPAGFTQVLEHGRDGRVRRVVRIWEKDGQATRREVIEERVLTAARETVVLRGTQGLPSRGGDWRRPLRMHATAYDPGPRSCGKYASGYTAIGLKAEKGVVAVDDRVIPMGTRLYIPGYGFAVAGDWGSAIKGHRIDLCFATYTEARQWGRRPVKVYLLD